MSAVPPPELPAGLTLRAATDDDSGGVIALIGATFAEYPGCVLDVDLEEPELRAPGSAFERAWVVTREEAEAGQVVGFVAFAARRGRAELKKLYVARDARGLGLGRRLVERVEAEARERGLGVVELWSDTRFETAHRVYERLGYARTGAARELHDLSRTTEWHYARTLPPLRP